MKADEFANVEGGELVLEEIFNLLRCGTTTEHIECTVCHDKRDRLEQFIIFGIDLNNSNDDEDVENLLNAHCLATTVLKY